MSQVEEANEQNPNLCQLAQQHQIFSIYDREDAQASKQIEVYKAKLQQRDQSLRIGVLALQGDFREHIDMLKKYKGLVEAIQVKKPEQIQELDGLIIPGGQSTTFGILAMRFGLIEPLKEFVKKRAVWGTCAGMIMLCNQHTGVKMDNQKFIGGIDAVCERNFFGKQVDSFDEKLKVYLNRKEYQIQGCFVRAPAIVQCVSNENQCEPILCMQGQELKVLSQIEVQMPQRTAKKTIYIAVQQDNILASSFHPQITGETKFFDYFLTKVIKYLP